VLNAWDLKTAFIGPVPGNVRDIAFSPSELTIYFALDRGELHFATFARS
jgi:hypothetical protein